MNTIRNQLRIAALVTWAAIILSEWQASPESRLPHGMFCLMFLFGFLWIDLRIKENGWNFAVVLLILGATGAVWFGGFGLTPALYVLAGSLLMRVLPRSHFWLVVVLLNAVLLMRLQLAATWTWALSGFIAYAGFQAFGMLMTSTSEKLENANQALTRSNAELEATRALLSESARSDERLRLSRELHDACGHKLTALKLTLRQAQAVGVLQGEDLALSQQLTDQLLQDVRAVVSTLRHHDGIDLATAMRALQSVWREPKIVLDIASELRSPDVETAHQILAITQEGITNAARHGAAKMVEIRLSANPDNWQLELNDDGKGDLPFKTGNGLLGMRERAERLGGQLTIVGRQPRGVVLTVRWPQRSTSLLEA